MANPIALASLLFSKKKPKLAISLSIISFAIAVSFTKWNEVLVSENGRTGKIISLDISYWIWITVISFTVVLSVYNLVMRLKIK